MFTQTRLLVVVRKLLAGFVTLGLLGPAAARAADFQVTPATVSLEGNFAQAQVIVTARDNGRVTDRSADLTRQAVYATANPQVVTVTPTGLLGAVGNGEATVTVKVGEVAQSVAVKVVGVTPEPKVSFREQVMPLLAKAGCNAGACHASQHGKGGFKLSVFGFNPDQDHFNIVREGLGRRVNFVDPAQSLVLLKPTLGVPHGGGQRLQAGSVDYQVLHRWLAGGAPARSGGEANVTGLQIYPTRRVGQVGSTQRLQVLAKYSNGKIRDVTTWARFDSTDPSVLEVSRDGLVKTVGKGQAAAMIRFEGQAEICTVVVPYADTVDLAGWVDHNFIDRLAAAKFREIGIAPSPLCDDATFLRRAYLDAIGTLPTPEQAAAFLDSKEADKRKKLIDRLLGLTGDPAQDVHNNAYAAYWALKWSDLVRSSSATLGDQGMWAMHNWIKESFRENKRMDRFVRELITAKGSTYSNGPSNYYRAFGNQTDLTEATAQLFLGVRIACAKCHHHPFEKISTADYYGFLAFFEQVGTKGSQEFGIFGGESVILVRAGANTSRPPTPLHGKPVAKVPDMRQELANWLVAPDNPYFARNIVNRYAGYLLGRGLVEPIDDMRATNPPSNVELMNALAEDFVKSGYNVKHLMRTIMTSRLYQLESQPTGANAADSRFYSHYRVKRVAAEPLLDALDAAAGTQTKFPRLPLGTRAIELPDGKYDNFFLNTFGKPERKGVCECERTSEPNLAQALHTLNGDVLAAKLTDPKGRVARLIAAKKPRDEIVAELYLATLSRRPTPEERSACQKLLTESPDAKSFYEDLLWTLVNSKQFLFVR